MPADRVVIISVTLLVLVCSIDTQSVSWRNITDIGLRNLPVNAFADLTAELLGSIPPRVSLSLLVKSGSIPLNLNIRLPQVLIHIIVLLVDLDSTN
jgi:hypothetical protein